MVALSLLLAGASVLAPAWNPPFPRIANCYGVGLRPDSSPQDLAEIARFDLLIGGVWCNWSNAEQRQRLAANLTEVRRLNPHIIVLDFSCSAPYVYPTDQSFPADGWLLQPDGTKVRGWPGTEMINLTKPDVVAYLAGKARDSVRERGFDGSFIDCMGGGFDWWACNIEGGEPYQIDADGDGTNDDRGWLDRTWVAQKTELSRQVREYLGPDGLYMTNQAGEWGKPTMNGILLEDYLDYVLEGRMGWDRVMGDYLGWCAVERKPNLTTIVSSSGLQPSFDPWKNMAEADRNALLERGRNRLDRMRFGLATTLMGDGYFAYDLHTRWRGQRWWYPEYDAPLGYAKGPGQPQADGTWRREFDGGTVVVNPTGFDARVAFKARHQDVSSGKVDSDFIVPSQDGRIFLPSDQAARPGSLPEPSPPLLLDGPDGRFERGGKVLLRRGRLTAMLGEDGTLTALLAGREVVAEGLRTFVVERPWQDFAYEGVRHEPLGESGVRFTAQRTFGEHKLACTTEYELGDDGLTATCRWEALTDHKLVLFRQQVDFPVRRYGGGSARAGEKTAELPVERAAQPGLLEAVRDVTVTPPNGPAVEVLASSEARLVDERHYGVDAFRVGLAPAGNELAMGAKFEARFELRVAR